MLKREKTTKNVENLIKKTPNLTNAVQLDKEEAKKRLREKILEKSNERTKKLKEEKAGKKK